MKNIVIISDENSYSIQQLIDNYNQHLVDSFNVHLYSYIRSIDILKNLLRKIYKNVDIFVFAFGNTEISRFLTKFCVKQNIDYVDLYSEYASVIGGNFEFDEYKRNLGAKYFHRVDCIEFAIENDDGKTYSNLLEADIIILGVSRTGKTPLSMYLALRGFKVVNIPLYYGMQFPEDLKNIDKRKIFGLINSANKLSNIRNTRIKGYYSDYSNRESIIKELNYAYLLYDKYGYDIINTEDQAIEEIANYIENIVKENY